MESKTIKSKNKKMKIAATVAGLVLLAVAVLPYLVNLDQMRPQLESALRSRLGREVHIGYLELSLLSGGARANSLSIADDPTFGTRPFLHAKSIQVGVSLRELIFSRSLHVTSLKIDEPELVLVKSASGKWNFSSLGANSEPDLSSADMGEQESSLSSYVLDRLQISNATLIVPGAGQSHVVKNINIDLRNASYSPAQHAGTFDRCQVSVRKSTARLSGTYQVRGESLVANLHLTGSQLAVDDVKDVLPALGIDLPGGSKLHGGTVDADLAFTGPVNRLVTSGTVKMKNTNLSGFDLGSKLSSFHGLSGMPSTQNLGIVNLSTGLKVGPQGTHISNFNSEITGIGGLTGNGDIDSANRLSFRMQAHITDDGVLRIVMNHTGMNGVPNDLPFKVTGTTSRPVVEPDLSAAAKQTVTDKAKDAIAKVFGKGKEDVPKTPKPMDEKPVAAKAKDENPIASKGHDTNPAPAQKKHRFPNPFHRWGNKKDKNNDDAALTAKK